MARTTFLRAVPVLLGLGLFSILTHGDLMFSADSVFYWSAARTLLYERHLATGIAYSNDPLQPGLLEGRPQALHPLTVFAPGYAVATAMAAWATRASIVSATLLVNLVSGAAIILLAGGLARRAGGEGAGCVAAALLAVLPFFQTTLENASPELLFVAFMLLAVQLLVSWVDTPDRGAFKVHMATLAIVAATYTRYIGISLAVVEVVVAAGCLLRNRSVARRPLRVAMALSLYPVLMAPLIWRNLSLTGYFGGAARPPIEKGIFADVADVTRGLLDALPLVRSMVAGPADVITSGALLVAATVLAFAWRLDRSCTPSSSGWTTTARLLALSAGIYCAILVALRSRIGFEDIGLRLLFPALVCLVVLAVVQMARLAGKNGQARIGAVWVIFAASATLIEASFHPHAESLSSDRERNRPVIRWAQQNLTHRASQAALIFADDVFGIHFATGEPIHMLPPSSSFQELRANSPVDHLIFVIGPPMGRSTLADESERELYEDNLDKQARDVQRGEDYAVWCIPTVRHERNHHQDCFPR